MANDNRPWLFRFEGSDVCLFWHPATLTTVITRTDAQQKWLFPIEVHKLLRDWDGRFRDSPQGPYARLDAPAVTELATHISRVFGRAPISTVRGNGE